MSISPLFLFCISGIRILSSWEILRHKSLQERDS